MSMGAACVGQSSGFDDLAQAIWALLDQTQREKDVHTAKMAMMLSQVSTVHTSVRRVLPAAA